MYPSPCKCYSDLRSVWLEKLVLSDEFFSLEMNQQLGEVLNHPCNVKPTARYIINCLDVRSLMIADMKDKSVYYHTDPPEYCVACNADEQSCETSV